MTKKTFPTLYAKTSTGKITVWRIWAEETKTGAKVVAEHGYRGSDNIQRAEVEVNKGKNIGRSNETTPFEQACKKAESKWNKKQNTKHVQHPSGKLTKLLPMLALTFTKRKHDINYPALGQPKLNGIRCLAQRVGDTKIRYTSREGKVFDTLDHLTPELLRMPGYGDKPVDGELFTRDLSFEDIVSAVKKLQDDTAKIQFWNYDIVDSKMPFVDRYETYQEMIAGAKSDLLVSVLCEEVKNEEDVMRLHDRYAFNGFEGIIVRNKAGLYLETFRSKDLQKHKDFIDAEFDIVGAHEGEGLAKGAVTWICVTKDGEEFECVPNGSYERRRKWWTDQEQYFGKPLTVRYQNLSKERQVPVFPKGIIIRDYE